MEYDTKQKKEVMDELKKSPAALSASQIACNMKSTGASTVYRILTQAVSDGTVSMSVRGRTRYYSYLGGCHHLHATCMQCGAFIHLDDEISNDISNLLEKNGLAVSPESVISCLCPQCRGKK